MLPRLSQLARADIIGILNWSEDYFGYAAMERYQGLIDAAIADVAADPERMLSAHRPELGERVRSWHIANSRTRSAVGRVRRPRHVLFYRVDGETVVIGRVLDLRENFRPRPAAAVAPVQRAVVLTADGDPAVPPPVGALVDGRLAVSVPRPGHWYRPLHLGCWGL